MKWLLQDGRFRPIYADYTVETLVLSPNCLHWGEPRILKRDHFDLDSVELKVTKTETLNPWLEVVDALAAVAWRHHPPEIVNGIADAAQLAELGKYTFGNSHMPSWELLGDGGARVFLGVSEPGEEKLFEASGFLEFLLKRQDGIWKLESLTYRPGPWSLAPISAPEPKK